MKDGHIHSPFCPHGSSDSLRVYVEQAIKLGYEQMTFSEHAPLPPSFTDPVPDKDSGMAFAKLEEYLEAVEAIKREYKSDLHILVGLEVDYIRGFEKETIHLLNEYGSRLDDSILSVHFLKGDQNWYCIDYSPGMFEKALEDYGSLADLYKAYFQEVKASIEAELGPYKPKRIGHMTLVRKFKELFPSPEGWEELAFDVLEHVKRRGLSLDYNGAGTQKPHCLETYPPLYVAERAHRMGIPLLYGSDAHSASGLKQGYQKIEKRLLHMGR